MKFKVVIKLMNAEDKDALGFGRGIVALLEGIDRSGSIYRSTRDMGMAYSKAWKIINKTEEEFGVTLIRREGPHGSTLTEEARMLISRYREMAEAAEKAADEVFQKYYA